MSSPAPHARPTRSCSKRLLAPGLLAGLLVCAFGCGDDTTPASANSDGRDDNFGDRASPFPHDAGPRADGGSGGPDGGGSEVVVRFVHALVNAGTLYVCHDPDLILDDPLTAEDEEVPGPQEPSALGLETMFGVTDAIAIPVRERGVLTLHLRPPPLLEDGGVPLDASADADAGDAGPLPVQDCARATRLAALALGTPAAAPEADAGLPNRRASLRGGPLLLVASGLALNEERLARRFEEARTQYLASHPDQTAEADRAGMQAVEQVRTTLGPALHIEADGPMAPPPGENFRVSLSQLTSDVSSQLTGDVSGAGAGPGSVRVCVTSGTLENPVEPPVKMPAIAFRTRVPLTPAFKPGLKHRFRVFAASKFDVNTPPTNGGELGSQPQDCATTGLAPLAELLVEENQLAPGESYDLLFFGAVTPTPLCSPVDDQSFVHPGCPLSSTELNAHLILCSTERCFARAPYPNSTR